MPPPPPPCPQVRLVSVAPDGVALAAGDSVQMQAAVGGGCGGPPEVIQSITWSSSDTRVLRVSAGTGLVHGVSPGLGAIRATITLGSGAGNGVATLRVVGLRIDRPAGAVRVGEQITLRAFRPGIETPILVRWALTPPSGGTMSDAGAFTACWPAQPVGLVATSIDDSSLTGIAQIDVIPIQSSNPIGPLTLIESASGAGARLDSLSEPVLVAIPIRGREFACHAVTRVRLELRDSGGGATLLADDSERLTASAIHQVPWLPAGQRPGEYQLVASAVIDGGSIVEGPPLSVRIQIR